MNSFDAWADYYDLIHQGLDGEAEFYVGQAVRIGGPVLELGCGTGRLSIPMAMSGVEVVGMDISPRMLDVCRAKFHAVQPVPGSLELIEGDMADFQLNRKFAFVAMAYRTFMHLHLPEQQRAALTRVREHLAADGVFILNTWLPSLAIIAGSAREKFVLADEYAVDDGAVLRHFHRAHFDGFLQRMIEEHRLDKVARDGTTTVSTKLPMVRVWTTLREMDNLVRLCGFAVEAVFGDFDCTPVGPECTEMIWVLRRNDAGMPRS